jgi:hypothetical protein
MYQEPEFVKLAKELKELPEKMARQEKEAELEKWREKQKELFIEHISLAKKLKKPIVIHSRDSIDDAVKILEQEISKKIYFNIDNLEFVKEDPDSNFAILSIDFFSSGLNKHTLIVPESSLIEYAKTIYN